MNRFQRLFADPKRRAFVPFFTLGDPKPQDSLRLIRAAIDAGADALELGLPFSDPVADGPTNQRSMARALAAGMTFDVGLELLAEIRAYAPDIPIGLLLYFNLLYRRGLARAHADLQRVGVDAIVSADLPLEESAAHEASLAKHDLGAIQMLAPNTPDARAQQLFARSSAFTYVLSGFGTTGEKHALDPRTVARVQHLRQLTTQPLVVGFGLSQPEHVAAVWQAGANGAIVGSRLSRMIEANLTHVSAAEADIVAFIQQVKALC